MACRRPPGAPVALQPHRSIVRLRRDAQAVNEGVKHAVSGGNRRCRATTRIGPRTGSSYSIRRPS